jgi:hypothetical protein
MKASSLNELKRELQTISPDKVIEVCMRLAKYKKENKELLTYLLFEADNEQAYIEKVKELISELFDTLPQVNLYLLTKVLRKILRITNKYIKYSGEKQTEAELLIWYCTKLKNSGINFQNSTALTNLYTRQLDKIEKAIAKMHEDLQYDYRKDIRDLQI